MAALNRWVYRVSDGQLCMGEGPDPAIYLTDQVNYRLIDLPDTDPHPNPRLQRVVSGAVPTLRASTVAEIAAFDTQVKRKRASTSIDNDLILIAKLQLDVEERQKLMVRPTQTLLTSAEAIARLKEIYESLLR